MEYSEQSLTLDCLISIFSFLGEDDLIRVSCVCKVKDLSLDAEVNMAVIFSSLVFWQVPPFFVLELVSFFIQSADWSLGIQASNHSPEGGIYQTRKRNENKQILSLYSKTGYQLMIILIIISRHLVLLWQYLDLIK